MVRKCSLCKNCIHNGLKIKNCCRYNSKGLDGCWNYEKGAKIVDPKEIKEENKQVNTKPIPNYKITIYDLLRIRYDHLRTETSRTEKNTIIKQYWVKITNKFGVYEEIEITEEQYNVLLENMNDGK